MSTERDVLDRIEFRAHLTGLVDDVNANQHQDGQRHFNVLNAHDAALRAERDRYREALEGFLTEIDLEGEWNESGMAVRITIPKPEVDRLRDLVSRALEADHE